MLLNILGKKKPKIAENSIIFEFRLATGGRVQEVSDRAMADVRSPSQLGLRRIPMVGILTAITHRRRQRKTSRLYLTGGK